MCLFVCCGSLQVSFTDRMVEPGMMLSINDIANEPRVEITDFKKEAVYSFIMVRHHKLVAGASSEGWPANFGGRAAGNAHAHDVLRHCADLGNQHPYPRVLGCHTMPQLAYEQCWHLCVGGGGRCGRPDS